jgi:general stress protein YciG
MDPERQREIARKGGAAVPSEKRSFSQDHALAVRAGKKGGKTSHPRAKPKSAMDGAPFDFNPNEPF